MRVKQAQNSMFTSGGRQSGIDARAVWVPLPEGVSNKWIKDSISEVKSLLTN